MKSKIFCFKLNLETQGTLKTCLNFKIQGIQLITWLSFCLYFVIQRMVIFSFDLDVFLILSLTHDFEGYDIALSGSFRVHCSTSIISNVLYFNMLKYQTLSAHYNALRGVLLQKATLKSSQEYMPQLMRKNSKKLMEFLTW